MHLAGWCGNGGSLRSRPPIHGDALCLGLAGPMSRSVETLTNVLAFEACTLCDRRHCLFVLAEIEQSPISANGVMQASGSRYHQAETMFSLLVAPVRANSRFSWSCWPRITGQSRSRGLRLNLRLTHQKTSRSLCTTRVTADPGACLTQNEGCFQMDAPTSPCVDQPSCRNRS